MATTDFSALLKTATGEERQKLLAGRYAKVTANDDLRKLYGEDALSREYLDSVRAAAGSAASVPAPVLRGAQDLASLYGNVQYDMDEIRGVFDKRTQDEYAAKRKEYQQTENNYYGQMYNTGVTAQDTLRKGTAQAIMTGAGRGMQAATELSALLGLQQEGVKGATDLAAARNLLVDQEQAALSKNAVDALTTANDTKLKLGTLSSGLYAADTQFSAAQMSALAAEQQAKAQLEAAGITATGNVNAAKETARGNIGAANAAGEWNFKSTGVQADATRDAAVAGANATRDAAAASAAATRDAAITQANANRYAADRAYDQAVKVNPTLQTLVDQALASGKPGVAAALIMQVTGTDKATAEAMLGLGAAAVDPTMAEPIGTQWTPDGLPVGTINTRVPTSVPSPGAPSSVAPSPITPANQDMFDNWYTHYVGLGMTPKEATAAATAKVNPTAENVQKALAVFPAGGYATDPMFDAIVAALRKAGMSLDQATKAAVATISPASPLNLPDVPTYAQYAK